jgi:hypothetical protein
MSQLESQLNMVVETDATFKELLILRTVSVFSVMSIYF